MKTVPISIPNSNKAQLPETFTLSSVVPKPIFHPNNTSGTSADSAGQFRDEALFDAYSTTVSSVVHQVAPTVVNIRVLSSERGQGGGSGFIIAHDGFILTNSHVVHGARDLEVTLHDSRVFPAQLVGTDPETDLAVIRIDAPNIQHVRLADSSKIRVGQIAIAVGSPYGFQQTV